MNFITTAKQQQKTINLARYAGFCYGVKRAVETTKKLKQENPDKDIYVLGELIHNSQVINELKQLGIKTVDELPENGSGICVIRSHGAGFEVFEDIRRKGYEIVDLTCPDVKKVQDRAIELSKEDYFVIILGKEEHPEVVAIRAYAQKYASDKEKVFVAKNVEALMSIEEKIKSQKKIGLVVQTTQRIEFLKEVVDYLIPLSKELRVINTICSSTSHRQAEAKNLALENDLMIVTGSKKSANTSHLAEILTPITETIHIEDDLELDKYRTLIENAGNIGLTAGASTPDYIIKRVKEKIEKMRK